ncbi:hypothetical protein [Rhodococcus ruber]|uniref:hypothetical protein n=1 Tax=Rhodococcus ruber TaxID=1830 RepID=UPI001FCA19C6|nr:hypothetical protein [Rhodococcus ruber]
MGRDHGDHTGNPRDLGERAASLVESPRVGWILLALFGLGGGLVAASIAGSLLIGVSVVVLVGGLAAVLVAAV